MSVALVVWVVCGFAIDSIGTYVEVYCIDRRRPDHGAMLDVWWKYLRIAWVHEPIGQHYLRRLLVSFKFELNIFVAILVDLLALSSLAVVGSLEWPTAFKIGLGLSIAGFFFAKAARDSSDVLLDARAALVKGVGEPPFDEQGKPTRSLT